MRIVFIGTVKFSRNMLKKLVSLKADIVLVLTKKESVFNSDFADLSDLCRKNSIDCRFVRRIADNRTVRLIKKKSPDIIFCFGWSELLRKEVLDLPKIGVVGYHPSLLPENRGRHPLIWALALGLSETGSTFFLMDEGADTGRIVSQRKVLIDYRDNAGILYSKVTRVAESQLEELFLKLLKSGRVPSKKQARLKGNYWRKRSAADGRIDWRMSSRSIYNLIRALSPPYCGAHFVYEGKEVKVWKASELKYRNKENIEPGKILEVYRNNSFLVKAADNSLKIESHGLKSKLRKGDYL